MVEPASLEEAPEEQPEQARRNPATLLYEGETLSPEMQQWNASILNAQRQGPQIDPGAICLYFLDRGEGKGQARPALMVGLARTKKDQQPEPERVTLRFFPYPEDHVPERLTSRNASHGFGPGYWCWHWELRALVTGEHQVEAATQARLAGEQQEREQEDQPQVPEDEINREHEREQEAIEQGEYAHEAWEPEEESNAGTE
jgi:hypothetical protein